MEEVRLLRLAREEREAAAEASQQASVGMGSGGYIVLDLPDEQKSMFHDVLKGFEEFAQLKGYIISFSIDGSLPNKYAFKFTIGLGSVGVSTRQVESDLQDYIARVQRGDDLSDVPIVVSDAEHEALLLAMRNRITFLQHTYTAQRNALEFYEQVLKSGAAKGHGITPAQTFYLQCGDGMSTNSYTATESQNVAQGKDIEASNNTVDQSIHIGQSFNEKKEQVDALDKLIGALVNHAGGDEVKRASVNLEKAKDEIANEPKPEASRVKKWLETAQRAVKAAGLGKDLFELAKETFEGFGLSK